MYEKIKELAKLYYPDTVNCRRDLHKYAEKGQVRNANSLLYCFYIRGIRIRSACW